MTTNYVRLTIRPPGCRMPKMLLCESFDDAKEREATDTIGRALTLAGQHATERPRIAVHDKSRLRKDLAKMVEEVGR